jgi:hypothetical protein
MKDVEAKYLFSYIFSLTIAFFVITISAILLIYGVHSNEIVYVEVSLSILVLPIGYTVMARHYNNRYQIIKKKYHLM